MKRYKVLGILLSVVLLSVVLYRADLSRVAAALREADYRYLPLAVIIYLTSFLLRSLRWGILLRPVKPGIGFARLFSTIIIGWTSNNLLPARVGELVRAYLIGKRESISKSSSLATIVVERILDSFILLVFLFASMLVLANPLETLNFGLYVLAAFLVMDIQHNPDWVRELADRIVEVKSGRLPAWERIGNAYRLELTGKGALLEDLVDENSLEHTVSLKDFSNAVEAWLTELE